jgi:hypothetical protein
MHSRSPAGMTTKGTDNNRNGRILGSFAALRMTAKGMDDGKRWGGAESVVGDCVLGLVSEVVVEESVAGFVAPLDLEE